MNARQMRILLVAASLGAGLLSPVPTLAQSYYRWVDDSGKIHYSDQRPTPAQRYPTERQKSLSAADIVSRTNRRNAAQPMQTWADSTRRFAPRAVAPDAPAFGTLTPRSR